MKRINESVDDFLKGIHFARGSGKPITDFCWLLYNVWLRTDTDLSFMEWVDLNHTKDKDKVIFTEN